MRLPAPRYYILRDKVPVSATMREWALFFGSPDRHVGIDHINGGDIHTVFLGIDHRFRLDRGEPLLFATVIVGGDNDGYLVRTCTWHQAEEAHERACDLVSGIFVEPAD
jgi:hypothetical protein